MPTRLRSRKRAAGRCPLVLRVGWQLLVLALLLVPPGCGENTGEEPAAPEAAAVETPASQWLAALAQSGAGNRLKVFIFYQSSVSNLLLPEENEIFRTEQLTDQAKQVIELLARGPSGNGALSPLPPGTRLRSLFLVGDGLAVADFSGEMSRAHPGGAWGERASIYAVVNSLAFNFPSIRRVKILVEGREAETLAGHLSLARPFVMDLSMVGSPLAGPGGSGAVEAQPLLEPLAEPGDTAAGDEAG